MKPVLDGIYSSAGVARRDKKHGHVVLLPVTVVCRRCRHGPPFVDYSLECTSEGGTRDVCQQFKISFWQRGPRLRSLDM